MPAALIILDNPQGNRITPSRGDGGIDLQIESNAERTLWPLNSVTGQRVMSQRNQGITRPAPKSVQRPKALL